ncbi:MAG: hypothetical protein RL240_3901 [Planctomycetota bacterium]|jgi:hypothetical protein
MNDRIINAVDKSISDLAGLFEREPTRFFTENDLVCCLHHILCGYLDVLGVATVNDKNNYPHSLVHCEFPTPFRCDMKIKVFEVKSDSDRTENGGKYKRGHFDVVVLNPEFVERNSYTEIKCQNYADFRASSILSPDRPMILYGIELVFSREPIKQSRGKDKDAAVRAYVAEVAQDAAKLRASVAIPGFMQKASMLTFTKGTTKSMIDLIQAGLRDTPIAKLIYASPEVSNITP